MQELNAGTDQQRLLASVGISGSTIVKGITQDYFDKTETTRAERAVLGFLEMMDARFRRPMEELVIARIQQRDDIYKKSGESIKEYCAMFGRLKGKLRDVGIIWPLKVGYQKAYVSIRLSQEQQVLVRAEMEVDAATDDIHELQRLASKLFDTTIQKIGEVCTVEEGEKWLTQNDDSSQNDEFETCGAE